MLNPKTLKPKPVVAGLLVRSGVNYGQRLANTMPVVEELPVMRASEEPAADARAQERRASVSPADSILHLSALQNLGERILLSAGADGVVKAWK